MNYLTQALNTVLPVLLMLVLGSVCRKKRLITKEGIQALKTVAVQIALPAVLLHTFAVTKYTLSDIVIPLMMYIICIAAFLLGKLSRRALRMNSPFMSLPYRSIELWLTRGQKAQ